MRRTTRRTTRRIIISREQCSNVYSSIWNSMVDRCHLLEHLPVHHYSVVDYAVPEALHTLRSPFGFSCLSGSSFRDVVELLGIDGGGANDASSSLPWRM